MITLHPGQSEVFEDIFINKDHRFFTLCCSRGWGKTRMAASSGLTAAYELLELDESIPNKNIYIIAPTYDQVTDIYFPLLNYEFGLEHIALRSYREQGRFMMPRNVELRLVSYEAVERIRGKGAYFTVWDEVSSCYRGTTPREAWEDIIQPAIITRWSDQNAKIFGAKSPGRGLFVGTPKGYNFFYDLYCRPESDNRWKSYRYDYRQSPYIDISEIERLRHTVDPITFASEYEAKFEESGYNVFYCFDRAKHVNSSIVDFIPPTKEHRGETIYCYIDFNVGLMCTGFFAIRGNQVQFIDEMQGHPDTEMLAKAIKEKYKDHKVVAFPDPTGRSRKTSATTGKTDFTILQNSGIECLARSKSPPIVDSVAAVNKKLLTAAGDIDFYVHPRCKNLIKSLERTKWTDKSLDSALIDKSENIEHHSDGVRYAIEYLFPILGSRSNVKRGFGF